MEPTIQNFNFNNNTLSNVNNNYGEHVSYDVIFNLRSITTVI